MQVNELTVDKAHHRYRVHILVQIDASPKRVYEVFTDFQRLQKINSAVFHVETLTGANPGLQRLLTKVRICVLFFCKELQQVQDMQELPDAQGGELYATVLPAQSDLRYGAAHWKVWPCADFACLSFDTELEPAFWVPPLIGPWAIKNKLEQEAVETASNIERLARKPAL